MSLVYASDSLLLSGSVLVFPFLTHGAVKASSLYLRVLPMVLFIRRRLVSKLNGREKWGRWLGRECLLWPPPAIFKVGDGRTPTVVGGTRRSGPRTGGSVILGGINVVRTPVPGWLHNYYHQHVSHSYFRIRSSQGQMDEEQGDSCYESLDDEEQLTPEDLLCTDSLNPEVPARNNLDADLARRYWLLQRQATNSLDRAAEVAVALAAASSERTQRQLLASQSYQEKVFSRPKGTTSAYASGVRHFQVSSVYDSSPVLAQKLS